MNFYIYALLMCLAMHNKLQASNVSTNQIRRDSFTTPQELIDFSKTASPYEILGIAHNADKDTIESAFKKLSLKIHPDKWLNQQKVATEAFKIIVNARDAALVGDSSRFYEPEPWTPAASSYQPKKQTSSEQAAMQMISEASRGTLTKERLENYLKQGADINAKSSIGNTPLMEASAHGHTAVVQQLIDARADLEMQNFYGHTALMEASYKGHIAVVQQLIAARADINAKDNNGSTALILASAWGHTAIVQQLIAAGADQTIANEKDNNKTARDYAEDKDAYDKAVAAGLQERKEYLDHLARQSQAQNLNLVAMQSE